MAQQNRCGWAKGSDDYIRYHDEVWGKPQHNDKELFRMLLLEGMQAGLSWALIVKKFKTLDEAFDGFDPYKVALYDDAKVEQLLQNDGIIKNRLKVKACITNAKLYVEMAQRGESFDAYFWGYVNGKPIVNSHKTMESVPASTPLSDEISKDLKKRGFKFIGTTIVYSFLQAMGLVNDHLDDCAYK